MVQQAEDCQQLHWHLPPSLKIEPDTLRVRLDFFTSTVVMHIYEDGTTVTRQVSVRDVARALLSEMPLVSGLLTPNTLWWSPNEVAFWEPPQVWPVALVMQAFQQPRRLRLPMPGLIFICRPGQPPRIFAAKGRPRKIEEPIFHAPLFNIFDTGYTCGGTHKYPLRVEDIPRSFFSAWFTADGHLGGRSKKHPDSLLQLWEEINGRKKYPDDDLVQCGTLADILRNIAPPAEPEGADGEPAAEAPL